jgi:hypothetical protein
MERHGEEVHITTEEARGGRTTKVMRFVLAISVLLAIVALGLVWSATRSSVPDINQAAASEQATAPAESN